MNMKSCPTRPPAGQTGGSGFTLIECIGVVTVVALVAAMLVPNVIRRLDQNARTRDAADLSAMVVALKDYVAKTKTVPSNLAGAISTNLALPLTLVSKTPRKTDRSFLIDPSFSISGGLPYKQTTAGTAKPSSARMMILSSLESNAPTGNFDTWWNTADTDALRIKRINLEPMFHQLLLVNRRGVKSRSGRWIPIATMTWCPAAWGRTPIISKAAWWVCMRPTALRCSRRGT
jgi:type II secretory pathway pseudopilin PulG